MTRIFINSATIFLLSYMLYAGLYNPSSPVLWLASTDLSFAISRLAIILILLIVLLYHPPRSEVFKLSLICTSVTLLGIVLYMILKHGIDLFDVIAFILASVILMIEALESDMRKPIALKISPKNFKSQKQVFRKNNF